MNARLSPRYPAAQRTVLSLTLLEDGLACLGLLRAHLNCRSCERTWYTEGGEERQRTDQ